MSEYKATFNNRLLTGLVVVLVLVTAMQGYYLFRIHNQLNEDKVYASNQVEPEVDWKVAPNTGILDPSVSQNGSLFDPNMWDPFKEMEEMQKQMDRMFEQAFGRFGTSPQFNGLLDRFSFSPKSDIEENDQEYIVRLDIPGTDSSKITATIEDRTLTISGVREEEITQQGANKKYHSERRLGKFERILALPGPVKQEGLKANYKDGVLTVTIPKDTAVTQSNTIQIL